jgi:hypothetical protein
MPITQLSDNSRPAVVDQLKQELPENATIDQRNILNQKFGIGEVALTASEKLLIEREERRGNKRK